MADPKDPLFDYDIHVGSPSAAKVHWKFMTGDEADDDAELEITPSHVVNMLGFDPKDVDEDDLSE